MKKQITLLLILLFSWMGCSKPAEEDQRQAWKAEIVAVEKAFNDMAQEEGLAKAFAFFAAEDGVIKRGKEVIKGKEAIAAWYEKDVRPNETLTWSPTFVEVSQSGDLAYTYGDFVFSYPDSLGNKKESTGIFHTVWKRQTDGNWRFVWD